MHMQTDGVAGTNYDPTERGLTKQQKKYLL